MSEALQETLKNVSSKRQAVDFELPESKKICKNAKKMALLLSYCGKDYHGMQRNPSIKTIEQDLMAALLKANLIHEVAYLKMQKIKFQRAARTDKGVSAIRQVVSLKLDPSLDIDKINAHLPNEVRVMGSQRVTKCFDAKNFCSARTYSYMLPTFAFAPGPVLDEDIMPMNYRTTPEILEKVKDFLSIYKGTHNFCHFTSKKHYKDPSNFRHILDFSCGEPFVVNDLEFVILQVKGQSFMMHQIRKMVGLAIAIIKGLAPLEVVQKCWSPEKVCIPMAPGLNLLLEEVHYDRYNKKYCTEGLRKSLDWTEYKEAVEEFKEKRIYPVIVEAEINENLMFGWLKALQNHSFEERKEEIIEPGVEIDTEDIVVSELLKKVRGREASRCMLNNKSV